MPFSWTDRPVLVTGGASFIGSHLVDALVLRGAKVRIADDFTSGSLGNLSSASKSVTILTGDLRDPVFATEAVKDMSIVFHLAADHGGRGYVDLQQVACATNFALDNTVFMRSLAAGVEKVVYASSGCVYPNFRQTDSSELLYLDESAVGPPFDADNLYGWAKLMGEMTLRALYQQHGLPSASCRYFTVYGERGRENHAVMAMIARAFIGQDPFEVWGDGEQVRNWTHVDDIVEGTIRAAERIDDATAINLGTMERIRVLDAVNSVTRLAGYSPRILLQPDRPTGPLNRVSNNTLARRLLGWTPVVRFEDGLARTFEWYCQTHNREQVAAELSGLLATR
ncbi:MAG: NAD-dependent epimerase/dehydratase family protein [Anaerolineaceae bacterium]